MSARHYISKFIRLSLVSALAGMISTAALAALKVGDEAPDFITEASMAGKPFQFSLKDARAKGPVVLYFYPAAFTKGCTIEAREFAEASDSFKKNNATVIGVSADDIEKLNRFSVSECQNKFAVASDEKRAVIKAYDAAHTLRPSMADRISYVISPEGKVIFVHTGRDPYLHVEETLKAVQHWAGQN